MLKKTCPLCEGAGQIAPRNRLRNQKIAMRVELAHKLHAEGYSYRQIMLVFGFKSIASVQYLLDQEVQK